LELLSKALAQVPYEQREVIGLYMQGGMTFRQIAKMQNASINTVQGRFRYGMDKLRSVLNGKMQK
jgi:RNA polymerase sigma-70 factor (ECF subfamily)